MIIYCPPPCNVHVERACVTWYVDVISLSAADFQSQTATKFTSGENRSLWNARASNLKHGSFVFKFSVWQHFSSLVSPLGITSPFSCGVLGSDKWEINSVHSLESVRQSRPAAPNAVMISSSSSKKVLFVSYVPQLYEPNRLTPRESQQYTSRTAIVVESNSTDQISIQGYAAVPYRDKHKCWTLFQVS